ncbi:hypothetical protein N8257_00515 [Ulvibacter sp.]|nr:hypothetical protein [Ulvibacter sp.]
MNIDFISAAESHYRAKMDEAGLTMKIYMTSSVGVGEHPQVFEEFRNSLEAYKDARENFQLIQELKAQYIKTTQDQEEVADEN